jgi:hypothetical protein
LMSLPRESVSAVTARITPNSTAEIFLGRIRARRTLLPRERLASAAFTHESPSAEGDNPAHRPDTTDSHRVR